MINYFLPIIVLVVCVIVTLLTISIKRNHGLAYLICGAGLMITMLLLFEQIGFETYQTKLFLFKPITPFLSLIMLIVVGMLWVQLYQWLEQLNERKEEYYLLLLFSTIGALLLVISNHFASFFLSLELMGLSLVGLVAYSGKDKIAQEAGIKYLILSAIASALILMGIAIIYIQYGTLLFTNLTVFSASNLMPAWVSITAIIFILAGVFFKLSLVPCHLWVADLFQGAPLPSAALLATLSKLSIFIVLWRMFNIGQWHNYQVIIDIISAVAIASMIIGNLLGLLQHNLLRLLAFSSIAHFGYLLIVLLLVNSNRDLFLGSSFATEAVVFYLVGYLFTLVGLFSVLMQMPQIKQINQLKGLFWHRPFIAITLGLLMLSLAGIPLTIGFMGKFYLVLTAVSHQLWWLLGALVLGSVIGLYYYLRVIMVMIQADSHNEQTGANFTELKLSTNTIVLNYLTIFIVIGFGTFPAAFSQLIQHLSRA